MFPTNCATLQDRFPGAVIPLGWYLVKTKGSVPHLMTTMSSHLWVLA
jgi:hypothetical protein